MVAKKKSVAIKNKSVQQQMWRLQNKLDTPRMPLEDKRAIEAKLQEAKKSIKYDGPTSREEERYKKEKRNLKLFMNFLELLKLHLN